ncbi:hypothetical protein BDR03DRAFT_1011188 [Suillus americanus]|nr:hypothetical protein BDR03DRAFT_1011188 [Suillus americanus]
MSAKSRLSDESKRTTVKVEDFLDAVDQSHLDTVLTLHWLQVVLTKYVPEVLSYQEHVSILFRIEGAKHQLPIRPKKSTCSQPAARTKLTTESNDVLVDFSGTYEKIIQLKKYLQDHADEFQSFEIFQPMLPIFTLANSLRPRETE